MEIQYLKELRKIYSFWNRTLDNLLNHLMGGGELPPNLGKYLSPENWERDVEVLKEALDLASFLGQQCEKLGDNLSKFLDLALRGREISNIIRDFHRDIEDLIKRIKEVQAKLEFKKRTKFSQEEWILEEKLRTVMEETSRILSEKYEQLREIDNQINQLIEEKWALLDKLLEIFDETRGRFGDTVIIEVLRGRGISSQATLNSIFTEFKDILEKMYRGQISPNEVISFLEREIIPFIEKKSDFLRTLQTIIPALKKKIMEVEKIFQEADDLYQKIEDVLRKTYDIISKIRKILESPIEERKAEDVKDILIRAKEIDEEIASYLNALQNLSFAFEKIKDQLDERGFIIILRDP